MALKGYIVKHALFIDKIVITPPNVNDNIFVYICCFIFFVNPGHSHCLSVNEAVNGIPPLSLSLSGQVAKKWEGKAARFIQLHVLLVHTTTYLHSLLELAMATKHHSV